METSLSKKSLSAISDTIVAGISKQLQSAREKQPKSEDKDTQDSMQSQATASQVG